VMDFDTPSFFFKFFPPKGEIEKHTLVVRTPVRGGYHAYMRTNKLVPSFKIRTSLDGEDVSVDIQSEGKFVLAPPSRINNKPYLPSPLYMENLPPYGVISVDDFEEALWKKLGDLGLKLPKSDFFGRIHDSGKVYRGKHPPCVVKLLTNGVERGFRNEAICRLASYFLFTRGLKPETTLERLIKFNKLNKPPLDESELRLAFKSVLKHGYRYGCRSLINFCRRERCRFWSPTKGRARVLKQKLFEKKIEEVWVI